jgi:hypothetical protein
MPRTRIRPEDLDIVGVPEIAERAGVKPSRVAKWAQRQRLANPDWYVAGSKLWLWDSVADDVEKLLQESV